MSLRDVAGAGRLAELTGLLDTCSVGGFQADFVGWGFYPASPWRNYWHRHSSYEVCLAYSGAGRFSIGAEHHDVGAGDVFVARPGDIHEIESSQTDPLGIAFWGFTLRAGREGPLPGERGWWSGLTDTTGPAVSRSIGSLASLVTALAEQAAPVRSGYETGLAGLGAALVVETARAFAAEDDLRTESPVGGRLSPAVAAMQRYLADNLSRPMTVHDVAAAVHLSERHAERLFREQTGASLMTTMRRMRLDLAAALLLTTDTTVTDVAQACGYLDVRAFSTAFRRRHGHSPLAHRSLRGTLHL
ncbi:AraC family transcriptional regulator [Streptomyces sp. 4503]|uniref:AraC family transcriptional regulator n=1 Tax=Streptomyces niphimycinicus TaxID=2842201 RepID=A0ABS6CHW7_9ACTN|nr:AraC family transcriptional regulator [Streptomyces niphimycinicus]MBU3866513.1 AraC family transcriptional regulator [Streptomyces niphimycinicus]